MDDFDRTIQFLFPDFISDSDANQIADANESGRTPVVFIHGLWLHGTSWTRWAQWFAKEGFFPVTLSWPHEASDISEARATPDDTRGTSIDDVVEYTTILIESLARPPILVGHSVGGLIAEILAGRGLAAATVAIAPLPFRGMSMLPTVSKDVAWPIVRNPSHRSKAFELSAGQFRDRFANSISPAEADQLFASYVVPAPARPLFDIALSSVDLSTPLMVNTTNPVRGPMLLVAAQDDRIVAPVSVGLAYRLQRANASPTELVVVPNAGHTLTIDRNWERCATAAIGFLSPFFADRIAAAI